MTQTSTLDLEAHRCPTAMIMARRAIETFHEQSLAGDSLYIQTIEPSFSRDLKSFVNAECEGLSLVKAVSAVIAEETKGSWQDKFDSEDWEGCTQSCYILVNVKE
jgi:TusA-related sulfurtransferase